MDIIYKEAYNFLLCAARIGYPNYKAHCIVKILIEEMKRDFTKEETTYSTRWLFRGLFHRENDLPAILLANGTKMWYKNGKIHRKGNYAIEHLSGSKEWWLNGEPYRENNLPVIEYPVIHGDYILLADNFEKIYRPGLLKNKMNFVP